MSVNEAICYKLPLNYSILHFEEICLILTMEACMGENFQHYPACTAAIPDHEPF